MYAPPSITVASPCLPTSISSGLCVRLCMSSQRTCMHAPSLFFLVSSTADRTTGRSRRGSCIAISSSGRALSNSPNSR